MPLTSSEAADLLRKVDSLRSGFLNAMEEIYAYISMHTAEPEPVPPPTIPDTWPSAGTWDEKQNYIRLRAGVKSSTLRTVGLNGYVPEGCSWNATTKRLDVLTGTLLENVYVPGTITPRASSSAPVTLRNVLAQDVFAFEQGGSRVALVEDCTFSIAPERVAKDNGWGQGCLNAMKAGFIVRRTVMNQGADGMQCSGGGTLEECLIENLTIYGVAPAGTHNDFIQNYGGHVDLRKCLFKQGLTGGQNSHMNGLFCDGGTYDVEDCAIIVTAPTGTNAWVLHAGKYDTNNQIVVRNSYIRGKVVEKTANSVVFESGVDYLAGY